MRNLLFFLFFLLAISTSAWSQNNVLSVGSNGIRAFEDDSLTIPLDSVEIGSPIYYAVHIINDGPAITDTSTVDLLCLTNLDSLERVIGTFILPQLLPQDSVSPTPTA